MEPVLSIVAKTNSVSKEFALRAQFPVMAAQLLLLIARPALLGM